MKERIYRLLIGRVPGIRDRFWKKRQQGGGALVRAAGVRLESLAVIASLENGTVTFAQ